MKKVANARDISILMSNILSPWSCSVGRFLFPFLLILHFPTFHFPTKHLRANTKTVLKSVNKMEQLGGMFKVQKFIKKIRILMGVSMLFFFSWAPLNLFNIVDLFVNGHEGTSLHVRIWFFGHFLGGDPQCITFLQILQYLLMLQYIFRRQCWFSSQCFTFAPWAQSARILLCKFLQVILYLKWN